LLPILGGQVSCFPWKFYFFSVVEREKSAPDYQNEVSDFPSFLQSLECFSTHFFSHVGRGLVPFGLLLDVTPGKLCVLSCALHGTPF